LKRKTVTICATLTAGVLGLVMWIVIHRGGEDGPLARPDLVENEHPGRSEVAEASDATRFMPEDEPALAHYDTPCADRVVGIVVDEAYQPLEGAAVAASLVPLSEQRAGDPKLREDRHTVATVHTSPDGRFAVPVLPGLRHDLQASLVGFAPRTVTSCYGGENLTIQLEAGAELVGRVYVEDSGEPACDARVTVRPAQFIGSQERLGIPFVATTNGAGAFRIEGLPSGHARLWTEAREGLADIVVVELRSGEQTVVDVPLCRGIRVHGQVTDATTSAPISNARVGWEPDLFKAVTTDLEGRYEFRGFLANRAAFGGTDLIAEAEGYGGRELTVPSAAAGDSVELNFELDPGRTCNGIVLDPQGTPLKGAYVIVAAAHALDRKFDYGSTRTAADGFFTIGGLRRDLRHAVFAGMPGFGSVTYQFPPDEPRLEVIHLGEIRLAKEYYIAGTVLEANGRPAHGRYLEMDGANSDRWRLHGAGFVPSPRQSALNAMIDMRLARRMRLIGPDGGFAIGGLCAGEYVLRIRVSSRSEPYEWPVTLGPSERLEGLELRLGATGAPVAGTAVGPDGEPAAGVRIELVPVAAEGIITAHELTDAHGRFEFSDIPDGDYALRLRRDLGASPPRYAAVPKPGIAPGTMDLVYRLDRARELVGTVLDPDGDPAPDVVLRASLDGLGIDWGVTDVRGGFSLWVPEQARVDVTAVPGRWGGDGGSFLAADDASVLRAERAGVIAGGGSLVLRLAAPSDHR